MIVEGGSLGEFAQVPQLDGVVVGARCEALVRGIGGQGFDGVGMRFLDGLESRDLVFEEILREFELGVILSVHVPSNKDYLGYAYITCI